MVASNANGRAQMVLQTKKREAQVSPATAVLLAAVALAVFNAVWTGVEAVVPGGDPGRGVAAYVYDLLSFLAAGTLAAACLAGLSRLPWRPVKQAAIRLAVLAVVYLLITDDLSPFLDRRAPTHADTLRTLAAVVITVGYVGFGTLAPRVVNSGARRVVAALLGLSLIHI